MSTIQSNSFSPILLSPSSTTITNTTNHLALFDNSDQGSVDSDYTSLGSSKFYGNSGSTSSLHRQGRSQSIDELASTTTIPTRHFNGTANKSNNDPLQFVKIHPNHDLIERAQEQLTLAESRKRLQENYKLTNNTNETKMNDDDIDWSKAVDNWRQKRELKRLKSVNSNPTDDELPTPPIKIESTPIPKPIETKKLSNEPVRKLSSPIEQAKPKSPTPPRIKHGPAKIREIFIEKPVEIRGFGFKLDGGRAQNRSIFISAIEEGSPADKAGLCIDDEVLSMNGENIENMTFDQVRKILKERNLRGSIKMVLKTYEDVIDDNSLTVSAGFTTERSRTPSPQKPIIPSISLTTTKPNITPSSTTNAQSSAYTSPSSNTSNNSPVVQTPSSSLNIFAPKPFRSTASINLDTHHNHESNTIHLSPIEAFRKMLDPSHINKYTKNESIYDKELQDLEAEFEKQLRGIDGKQRAEATTTIEKQPPPPPSRVVVNTPPTFVDPPSANTKPVPLSSVESLLHGNSNNDNNQERNDSPIAQVRSYVEKQMDQLQQDLEFGFSRTPKIPPSSSTSLLTATREQRPIPIPVELTPPSSSLKKSSSTQNELDQIPSNRTYGLKINPNQHIMHYTEPYTQQRPSSSYTKRSIPDLPSMTSLNRPSTAHSLERSVNELRINMSIPYPSQSQVINPQQKKVTIQVGEKISQQRMTSKQIHSSLNQVPKKIHFEDHTWMNGDQRKQSNNRRSAPLAPHHQELQMNRQPMYNYDDQQDSRQHRTKSPNRTTGHNNRVLSVSGKLRCSRCNDELGQGSAMVIESLGLYYHIECFRCCVCNIPLSSTLEGIDVRIRTNRLHCQNCFSDENGVKLSAV